MPSEAGPTGLWHELAAVALLGVERQPPAIRPTGAPALDAALAPLAEAEPELALLGAAAVLAQYRRAGLRAAVDAEPDEPCPPETHPLLGGRAGGHLAAMLAGEHAEVLPEWLAAVAAAGKLVPPRELPDLLDHGAKQRKLREPIAAVVGERGRWLAAQNLDWRWLLPVEDEAVWRTGDREERLALLRHLRGGLGSRPHPGPLPEGEGTRVWHRGESASLLPLGEGQDEGVAPSGSRVGAGPGRARELLLSTWAEETPDDRLLLLNELATGLSMEDEPFLEQTLDDRRTAVRQRAAELLARLPESRLVQRMAARADEWLVRQPDRRSGLRALLPGGGAKVEVRLPTACDKAMQRDGVDPKPIGQRGERGWWLLQTVRVVPLGHWVERWGATPAEIVAAALRSDEAELLVETWTEATRRQHDLDWARAFMDTRPDEARVRPLIGLLPPAEREARVLAALADDDSLGLDTRATHWLTHCDHVWGAELSRRVLRAIADHVAAADPAQVPMPEVTFRHRLGQYANHLNPTLADEAAALPWSADHLQRRFWVDAVDAFLARLRFRRDMLEEIAR